MEATINARTPAHLWIVGGLATLWNAFGAYDYLMTRMRNMDYLNSMMPGGDATAMLTYVDSFPLWAQAGWGMGVWFGLLGSIMLLVRSRWAVHAFILSLAGMVLSFGYQFTHPSDIVATHEGAGAVMPYVIMLVELALLAYASANRKKGLLR